MPPSEPPSASKPKRRVARKAKPQPPSSEALKGRAYGSRPARPVAKPRAVRVAQPPRGSTPAPVRVVQAAARAQRPSVQRAPKAAPRPSAKQVQQAAEQGYVSQGRAVEHQARSQERRVYTQLPLANRRHMLQSAKLFESAPGMEPNEYGKAALQVHHERHAKDVQDEKQFGELPRVAKRLGAAQSAAYVSQGQAVEKAANEQERKAKNVKVGQFKVPKDLVESDPKKLKAAGFTVDKADKVFQTPVKALANVPKDVKELAITTPTSLAHMGVRGVSATVESAKTGSAKPLKKAAVQTGKELIEPYKQLVKHPVEFVTEHPVTTALMVAPTVKAPGLAAGRVARVAGKQSLERPAATLAGTSLKEQRIGSRSAGKRYNQTREDRGQTPITVRTAARKTGHVVTLRKTRQRLQGVTEPTAAKPVGKAVKAKGPAISQDVLHRRVDEFYDSAGQHKQNATESALKEVKKRTKDLPKDERGPAMQEHVSGARAGADQHSSVMFAREFGSHWQRDPKSGAIIKPKNPEEGSGVIHTNKADADAIAERVPFDATVMKLEGKEAWAVVPKTAAARLRHHGKVGTEGETNAVLLRASSRAFRRTVLPMSTKWLGGQVTEGGIRAAAMGAGPTSYLRGKRLLKAVEKDQGRSAMLEVRGRTTQGGQFGATGPSAEFAKGGIRTLAEEFKGTGIEKHAQALTNLGSKPGVRHTRAAYRAYAGVVFGHVNGRIEAAAKTAMLGKALKQGPLLERHVGRLSGDAMADAAHGLRNTSSQVQLGRALDRAYGKYSKFGPHARSAMTHMTPFFPWFKNMADFLVSVMPRDHPVRTALVADLSAADQEWRKQHELSYYGGKHKPDWMMGAYAKKDGTNVPVGRFGPALPGEFVGALGGQVLPQAQGMLLNTSGSDWSGKEIKNASQERLAANVALTAGGTFIPGVGVADRVTGLGDRYVRGKTTKPSVGHGKNIGKAILDTLNPVKPIGTPGEGGGSKSGKSVGVAVKIKPVKVKPVKIKPVRVGP